MPGKQTQKISKKGKFEGDFFREYGVFGGVMFQIKGKHEWKQSMFMKY